MNSVGKENVDLKNINKDFYQREYKYDPDRVFFNDTEEQRSKSMVENYFDKLCDSSWKNSCLKNRKVVSQEKMTPIEKEDIEKKNGTPSSQPEERTPENDYLVNKGGDYSVYYGVRSFK